MKKLALLALGVHLASGAFAQSTTTVCGPTALERVSNMVVVETQGWPNGCPGYATPNMANIWRNVSNEPVGTVIKVCANYSRLTPNWQLLEQKHAPAECKGYSSSANGVPYGNVFYFKRLY